MPATKWRRRGGLLIMTMAVALVLSMMTATLLSTNRNLLAFTGRTQEDLALAQLTQGAVNRMAQYLSQNPTYAGALDYSRDGFEYHLTFDTTSPQRSVNNLANSGASPTPNFLGGAVRPYSADLCVRASWRRRERLTHVVLAKGLAFTGAAGCNGRLKFIGDTHLDGIQSLSLPNPVPAFMQSNATGLAVDWTPPGGFVIQNEVKVSAVGNISTPIVSANPGKTAEDQAPIVVPDLDIAQIISDHASAPAPTTGPGSLRVSDIRHTSSNLTINGDLNLYDGSLYVDGDLIIHGGVNGYGAVYATGNIEIQGGNASVVTNQHNGAALFAGGDVKLIGLDAAGYLQALATANPATLGPKFNDFKSGLQLMKTLSQNGGAFNGSNAAFTTQFGTPDSWLYSSFPGNNWAIELWWAGYRLGSNTGTATPLKIQSPDGSYASTGDQALIASLNSSLQALPGYAADPKAQQISRGLDQLNYYFRHNWNGSAFDDTVPGMVESGYSLDHQIWLTAGYNDPSHSTYSGPFNEGQMAQGIRDFFRYNDPLNFGWLGRAYFQGLVYAKGSVRLTGQSTIYGMVLSQHDLELTDSELVYDKEYEQLSRGVEGPIRVTLYQEI